MASVYNWLKKFILRSFIYVFGIIIVLVVVGGVAFVVARPQINDFVNKEIKKYGIELESWNVGLTGKANLYKVRISLNDGTIVTVREISARPPLSSFKGVADLYDVKIERGNIIANIPRLHVDGIVQNDKDSTIQSKKMQMLMQIGVSSIRASDIEIVSNVNNTQETAIVKGFALDNLAKGKISFIGFDSIQTTSNFKQGTISGLQLQSGIVNAKNIDVVSAYALMENILSKNQPIVELFGPINLSNINVVAGLNNGKKLHVSLGSLKTEGFSLRNLEKNPIAQVKTALGVLKNENASKEERAEATKTFLQMLETIAKVDGILENLVIDVPEGKLSVASVAITPNNWNDVIPEALLMKVDDVVLDLSDIPNENIKILKEMGYNQLNISMLMNLNWNRDDNSLNINQLSFTGKDMGQLQLSGKLKNIDPKFFSGDIQHILMVASVATLQNLDIVITDYGIFDKIIKWEAPLAGTSESDFRSSIKIIAVESPKRLLKNHKDVNTIANAFGSFVDNPGTINIHMVAKPSNGLGILDFMLVQTDPLVFWDKLDLTVTSMGKAN